MTIYNGLLDINMIVISSSPVTGVLDLDCQTRQVVVIFMLKFGSLVILIE